MPRSIPLLICVALLAVAVPASAQTPSPSPVNAPDRVVIAGRASAHGLGMAMDGVEGQARAGWSHDRILNLFYPGTSVSRSGHGTIRVWIAEGGAQRIVLPAGGVVGAATVPAGAAVTVSPAAGGRLQVRIDGLPRPKPAGTPAPGRDREAIPAGAEVNPPSAPIPPAPTPTPEPTPKPTPGRTPPPSAQPASIVPSPLMVTPRGSPALTTVTSVGRRYRGSIQLRRAGGGVRVINHVTLDDYVSGIVEERGQGWPLEGLKTLAVAARTLGVATMTWHDHNHAEGYDICPTDKCQVYFGYDGEEYTMRRAALETSGEIRTYNGRPILAMYHGNGGGQTASYKEMSGDNAGNAFPYLTSVKYPYADPWRWQKTTTLREIESVLRGQVGEKMPAPLSYVIVLKRGESPRVKRVGLFDKAGRGVAITGFAFARAMDLPSPWFYVHLPRRPPRTLDAAFLDLSDGTGGAGVPRSAEAADFPWPLAMIAGGMLAFAALSNWTANGGTLAAARTWRSLRKRASRVPRPRRRRAATPQPAPDVG